MGGEGTIPALRVCAGSRQGNVFEAVWERQDLCGLLSERRYRHPPELSLFRCEGGQGRHAGTRLEPLPRGQRRGALFLSEGRDGLAHRLYGLHLARQAFRHQDPRRPPRAGGLRERQALLLHTARAAQILLRRLPCPGAGRAPARRNSGPRARHSQCVADLSFRMERHGHHKPTLHHLQQPDPRGTARAAIRRISRSRIFSVLHEQRAADLGSGSTTMNGMTAIISVALLATGLLTSIMTPAIAASEADFRAAFAAAEAAEKE